MKNTLTSFSVKHPLSLMMIVLALSLLGALSLFLLPLRYFPLLQNRFLLVSSSYEGLSAEQMTSLVTQELESSCASLKGVKNITSVTRTGLSLIKIELEWGRDADLALLECREIIDHSYSKLPSACNKPEVSLIAALNKPTLEISIIPLDEDLVKCRKVCEEEIIPLLRLLPGLSNISINGGQCQEVLVSVNKNLLDARGLDLQQVAEGIYERNIEFPLGTLTDGQNEYSLKSDGLFSSLEDFNKVPLSASNGEIFFLSDLAKVSMSNKERESFFLLNDKEGVCLSIYAREDTSPLILSRLVKKEIEKINEKYSQAFEIRLLSDSSIEITNSIRELLLTALLGSLICFAVLLFFMRSFILSLIPALFIPLCLLFSFLTLMLFGKSINIISLTGIALSLGMVVDGGIVVLENIHAHFTKANACESLSLPSYQSVIISSATEVTKSTFASALTTVIVFIPLFFIKGISGALFKELGIAAISSMLSSVFFALCLLPAILSLIFNSGKKVKFNLIEMTSLETCYCKLNKLLFNKTFIIVLLFSSLLFSLLLFIFLKKEVMPESASDKMLLTVECPQGHNLSYMREEAENLALFLNEKCGVKDLYVKGGIDSADYLKLSDPFCNKNQLYFFFTIDKKSDLSLLNELQYKFSLQNNKSFLSEILPENNRYKVLREKEYEDLKTQCSSFSNDELLIFPSSEEETLVFTPDRVATAHAGISSSRLSSFVYSALEGIKAGTFYSQGSPLEIKVSYSEGRELSLSDLSNLLLPLSTSFMPLSAFGRFEYKQIESVFYRIDRSFAKIISLPEDKMDSETISLIRESLFLILIVFLLLYCLIGAQFESYKMPLYVFLIFPSAVLGAFIFLFVFNKSLNLYSLLALIVLFGTSINNALLLFESTSALKIFTRQSIMNCISKKLSSVLLTSLTSFFSMLPFALNLNNPQSSLALAFCGGLLFSTLATLFLFPSLILHFYKSTKESL